MRVTASNPELSSRWSEWLLWRDRRGMAHELDPRMQKMFEVAQAAMTRGREFIIRVPTAAAAEAVG
jgi:hypothetical protein